MRKKKRKKKKSSSTVRAIKGLLLPPPGKHTAQRDVGERANLGGNKTELRPNEKRISTEALSSFPRSSIRRRKKKD